MAARWQARCSTLAAPSRSASTPPITLGICSPRRATKSGRSTSISSDLQQLSTQIDAHTDGSLEADHRVRLFFAHRFLTYLRSLRQRFVARSTRTALGLHSMLVQGGSAAPVAPARARRSSLQPWPLGLAPPSFLLTPRRG